MRQTIPLYACNADVVYMESHQYPRYTQGAFIHAFKSLFENYSGSLLDVDICGKPFKLQYTTAEEMISECARNMECQSSGSMDNRSVSTYAPTIYYGIGDNPKADIRGANDAGHHWNSVLVRTGVFQGINCSIDVADIVADDIGSALDIIFEKHNL